MGESNRGWRVPLPRRFIAARQRRLVGRATELSALEAVWSRVEAGFGQVVLIGGEPGAGKTRLAAEVAGALYEHNVTVLVGTATRDAGVPYQPFAEMLDDLFRHSAPGSLAAALADLTVPPPTLGQLSSHVARHVPAGERPAADVRRDLFQAVAQLLRRLAEDRPQALIVDDLHWATPPSIALLEHLAHAASDARILLIATLRTTAPECSDELSARLAELYRLDSVHRLDLAGLDTEAIAQFVVERGGVSIADARASAAMLRDRTGGNPFFLRELWNDLERRGGLTALRGRHHIPASISDTIGARLAGLGAHVRETVELAAVIGDTFDVDTLVRATSVGQGQSIDALDAAVAVGLIELVDDPPGRYGFVHSLTRQVILDRLTKARLRLLHAAVAEALDRGPASDPALIPRLAHHYLAAQVLGYQEQARRYASLAAEYAARSLAFEEAAQWYERAAALPESDQQTMATLLFGAAENRVRAGDFARARELYDRLAFLPDPIVRLRAAMGYEDANWRPGLADTHAADLLAAAIDGCGLGQDDPLYVRALGSLGRALTFAGQSRKAREVGERAINLARRLNDPPTLVHALKTSLWHGLAPEVVESQHGRFVELAALSLDAGDFETLGAAAQFGAMASYMRGRPADLAQARDHVRTAAHALGQPFFDYVATCLAQGQAYLAGDFAEATRLAQAALDIGEILGVESTEGPFGVQMFMIARETGGLAPARPFLTGRETFTGRWIPGMLALYTELGISEGAQRALRVLLSRDLDARTGDAQWPIELVFMAEAALALGDRAAASALMPFLDRFAGLNIAAAQFVAAFGSADRYRAALACLLGDHTLGDRLFEEALVSDRAMGSVVHVAETLARHALAVSARPGGDARRAAQLARDARDHAQPIGQQRVLAWVQPLLEATRPDGLTRREQEVLVLIAQGFSNRDIASRLYISVNTAANHVRSILTKTGAANRTQAARYASEHGLI